MSEPIVRVDLNLSGDQEIAAHLGWLDDRGSRAQQLSVMVTELLDVFPRWTTTITDVGVEAIARFGGMLSECANTIDALGLRRGALTD